MQKIISKITVSLSQKKIGFECNPYTKGRNIQKTIEVVI